MSNREAKHPALQLLHDHLASVLAGVRDPGVEVVEELALTLEDSAGEGVEPIGVVALHEYQSSR